MIICPCTCTAPKRHANCHSTCPEYKQYRKELDERNLSIRKAKEKEVNCISYSVDLAQKLKH